MTVIKFPGLNQTANGDPIVGEGVNLPVNRILDGAKEAELGKAIVIGETETGNWYFATTHGNTGEILHALEIFKGVLLGYVELEDD